MFLRYTTRKKGKTHRYWRVVRSVGVGRRVVQQTVAQPRALEERGRVEARGLALHLIGEPEQAGLFDDGSEDLTMPVLLPTGKERVGWAKMVAVVTARICEPSSEVHIAEDWYRCTALADLLAGRIAGSKKRLDPAIVNRQIGRILQQNNAQLRGHWAISLVVFHESWASRCPREGSFDDPPPRQKALLAWEL